MARAAARTRLETDIGEREMHRRRDDPRVERIRLEPLSRREARVGLLEQIGWTARDRDRPQREPGANDEPMEVARLGVRDRIEAGRDRGVPVAERQECFRAAVVHPAQRLDQPVDARNLGGLVDHGQRRGGIVVPVERGTDAQRVRDQVQATALPRDPRELDPRRLGR